MILTYGGNLLRYGANLVTDGVLAPWTLRFQFTDTSFDPVSAGVIPSTAGVTYGTWKQVSASEGLWDWKWAPSGISTWAGAFAGLLTESLLGSGNYARIVSSGDAQPTTTAGMFSDCEMLVSADMKNVSMMYCENMSSMFNMCTGLTAIPEFKTITGGSGYLSFYNTEYKSNAFRGCVNIADYSPTYEQFTTSGATSRNIEDAFYLCGFNTLGGYSDWLGTGDSWGGPGTSPYNYVTPKGGGYVLLYDLNKSVFRGINSEVEYYTGYGQPMFFESATVSNFGGYELDSSDVWANSPTFGSLSLATSAILSYPIFPIFAQFDSDDFTDSGNFITFAWRSPSLTNIAYGQTKTITSNGVSFSYTYGSYNPQKKLYHALVLAPPGSGFDPVNFAIIGSSGVIASARNLTYSGITMRTAI